MIDERNYYVNSENEVNKTTNQYDSRVFLKILYVFFLPERFKMKKNRFKMEKKNFTMIQSNVCNITLLDD